MLSEPIDIAFLVIDCFDSLEIPYWIGGSLASAFYGITRSTLDADLIAEIGLEEIDPLVEMLGEEFYLDSEMIASAIRYQSSFNLIHLDTMFKVDVFILKSRPYDQEQLRRRKLQIISSDPVRQAYICSAEDLVLAKLEWYRLGGESSDRQWRDILGVLKAQSGWLDANYLRMWASRLNVLDLLERVLGEAI